jgi:hypothetical protein
MPIKGAYVHQTWSGRVVYKRKAHYFTPKRLFNISTSLINRMPLKDEPDAYYLGWLNLAKVAQNAALYIGKRWQEPAVGALIRVHTVRQDQGWIIQLWRDLRKLKDTINTLANFGAWIPELGPVLDMGSIILNLVWQACEMDMPMVMEDSKGVVTIYW